MELPTHPLLSLVEDNANGLKSMLTNFIDDTVDYQFAILKNRILKMIKNGLIKNGFIDPLYSENASILHHSNDQLANSYEQNNISSSADANAFRLPHSPLNTTQANSSNEQCPLISLNANDQLITDQITLTPTNRLQTSAKQSNSNMNNHNYDEDSEDEDCEDWLDEINEESDDGDDESSEQINHDYKKSSGFVENQKLGTTQSQVKAQSQIQTSHIKSEIQSDEPVNQQSIPSTSGIRSSDRKRIPRKVFGDVQSNDKVKSNKRKSKNNSGKVVKKVKQQDVDEIHLEGEVDAKHQIVTLELNCTEPGCEKTLKSREMWKKHLSKCHGQIPYKHLYDNVRHNQHGQTEYPCTQCELVCISQDSLYVHWRDYHQAGKYKCSLCAFVTNSRSEVRNHQRNNHRSDKFQCTHEGCNKVFSCNYDLVKHLRIHSGEKPFVCIWKKCKLTFNQHTNAIRHVRIRHFHLPQSVKEQQELNIIDTRDPKVFIEVRPSSS